jgi:hypothetical protein
LNPHHKLNPEASKTGLCFGCATERKVTATSGLKDSLIYLANSAGGHPKKPLQHTGAIADARQATGNTNTGAMDECKWNQLNDTKRACKYRAEIYGWF